jgi:hypothetical protein
MAVQRYTVYAYSPTLNQQVRQFDLAHVDSDITEQQAQRDAYYFALLQNTNCYMNTQDWQAKVVLELHGIDTIPGYIG